MKTIKRTMYYPSFDEKTNSFDYNEFTHERTMTKKERKWNIASNIFWWGLISIFIVSLILTAVFCVNKNPNLIGAISLGVMLGSLIIMLTAGRAMSDKYERIMDLAQDEGFDDEILRWEQICQEQNDIAEQWRKDHPLEEAIRKAQLSKNCNDIATLARMFAKEIKGE